jgi:hypothetical protein
LPRTLLVPPARIPRWFENFTTRHGEPSYSCTEGSLHADAPDGATAVARLPFGREYAGPPDPGGLADAAAADSLVWGVLLVRKGGFAVAKLRGDHVLVSKVGQRHVQGRTKAGGQSQQRFARRRANQARQAFEAAADHAHRILLVEAEPPDVLVCGGDRAAVDEVLSDPRLTHLTALRTEPWLAVPDPRRSVLEEAIRDGSACPVEITEPEQPGQQG